MSEWHLREHGLLSMDDETKAAFAALNDRFNKLEKILGEHVSENAARLGRIEKSVQLQSGSIADLAESVTDRLREVADIDGKVDVIESKIDDANRTLLGSAKETSLKQLRAEHGAFQRVLNDAIIKTNRRVDEHDGRIESLEEHQPIA